MGIFPGKSDTIMKMKIRADIVIIVCKQYEEQRDAFKVSMAEIADSEERLWMDIRRNNDDRFFENIKKMAIYAEQSEYPYIIINEKEFNLLDRFL
jgi:hypothetical protein